MKAIIYILIAVFISSILMTAIPINAQGNKNLIILESENPDINLSGIYISAEIIKQRLEKLGLEKYDIQVSKLDSTIQISLPAKLDLNEVKDLLTVTGSFEFYETSERKELLKHISSHQKLMNALDIPDGNNLPDILGFCKPEDKIWVDEYLSEHLTNLLNEKQLLLLWSKYPNANGLFSLYVLKSVAVMDSKNVAEAYTAKQENSVNAGVFINLDDDGRELWQEITNRNIGKSIALVIDNEVYFAPRVMEEIGDGKCMISGNFSQIEANRIVSLITTKRLPAAFKIVE